MKAKHLMKGLWGGLGGALMGSFYGFVAFTVLAAAHVISGGVSSFLLVAAAPMLVFGAREAIDTYRHSIENARDPVDPVIMAKLKNPPGPIPYEKDPSQPAQQQQQAQAAPSANLPKYQPLSEQGYVGRLNAERLQNQTAVMSK